MDRLEAIVRAYVLPAFSSGSDLAGAEHVLRGCAR